LGAAVADLAFIWADTRPAGPIIRLPTYAKAYGVLPEVSTSTFSAVYFSITASRSRLESKECKITTPRVSPAQTKRAQETPEVVADQSDYAAYVQGLISEATGSIETSGGTSAAGVGTAKFHYKGILVPNEYSLQINTQNYISTFACRNGASNCTVWQQFVYAPGYNVEGEAAGSCNIGFPIGVRPSVPPAGPNLTLIAGRTAVPRWHPIFQSQISTK
jgi:hypothetical protein